MPEKCLLHFKMCFHALENARKELCEGAFTGVDRQAALCDPPIPTGRQHCLL